MGSAAARIIATRSGGRARASPNNGRARGKVPPAVTPRAALSARLFLPGYGRLCHGHGIRRRKRIFERLLQRGFLCAFLGSIARLLLAAMFGHGLLGRHGITPSNPPRRRTRPSRRGRCRAIGETSLVHWHTRPPSLQNPALAGIPAQTAGFP